MNWFQIGAANFGAAVEALGFALAAEYGWIVLGVLYIVLVAITQSWLWGFVAMIALAALVLAALALIGLRLE